MIIHGIDYNKNGVYDGVLDRSDLNPQLNGETTAPALCGRLLTAQGAAGTTAQRRTPGADRSTRRRCAPLKPAAQRRLDRSSLEPAPEPRPRRFRIQPTANSVTRMNPTRIR